MFRRFLKSPRPHSPQTTRLQTDRMGRGLDKQRRRRLLMESLEDRRLLAVYSVSNLDDGVVNASGDLPGSLRQAIFDANANSGADRIEFAPSVFTGGDASLIRLTQGELEITDSLTIDASMASDVTITGDANNDDIRDAANITDVAASFGGTAGEEINLLADNSRVLNFSSFTGDLTLDGLTVTGGRTTGDIGRGGGIRFRSDGSLSLTRSTVSGNSTAGRTAQGGGILAGSGDVSLTSSTVSGNRTTGSDADGGGIYAKYGDVSVTSSTVSGNSAGSSGGGGSLFPTNHCFNVRSRSKTRLSPATPTCPA